MAIATEKALEERDYERAIPLLEETVRANARDWNAQDKLARALAAVGRVPDAVAIWLKTADCLEQEGFRVVVRDRLRMLQRLSPDDPGITARLAALEGKGECKGE